LPCTSFAHGCSCSQEILEKFDLRNAGGAANPQGADPQVYGLGIKEVWKVDPAKHKPGSITHTMGWPLDMETYGGSFLYHAEDEHVYVGFVVGLDYPNPYLSPYEEFQRWKTHPAIRDTFEGGTCISYGARCINEGGWQAVPKLTFPGGMLAGCSAGFVNVPKIKGSHTAMKTGMLAAEEAFKTLSDPANGISVNEWYAGETDSGEALEGDVEPRFDVEVCSYDEAVSNSWVKEELWAVRNVHPSFHKVGPIPAQLVGMAYSGLDSFILKGRGSWTFHNKKADSEATRPENDPSIKRIEYPKPDGVLTFDLL
jgi:electron-transferring-flavoprotein dehydrogenase